MIKIYQNILGENGNCMAASIASIMELPLEHVPHFIEREDYVDAINELLKPFGIVYMQITLSDPDVKLHGFHTIEGQGIRGRNHCCVGFEGELVHDPFPDGPGIETIENYGIFIVLDPSINAHHPDW